MTAAERGAYREDKARLGNELAAVKSDRDLVHSLNERLASDEKRRMELVNSLLERLASEEEQRKLSLKTIEDVRHLNNYSLGILRTNTNNSKSNGSTQHFFCCSSISVSHQMGRLLQSPLSRIQEIRSRTIGTT